MARRLIVSTVGLIAVLAVVLFASAGTLDWPAAWGFLAEMAVLSFAVGLWLARHDPGAAARGPHRDGGAHARGRARGLSRLRGPRALAPHSVHLVTVAITPVGRKSMRPSTRAAWAASRRTHDPSSVREERQRPDLDAFPRRSVRGRGRILESGVQREA